jgi:hypothetical protein
VVHIKILGMQYPERYVVRRLVAAAQQELASQRQSPEINIAEVTDPGEIGKYAYVLVLPTLVINERVVCSGRVPSRQEVTAWLLEAVEAEKITTTSLP